MGVGQVSCVTAPVPPHRSGLSLERAPGGAGLVGSLSYVRQGETRRPRLCSAPEQELVMRT